MGKQKAKFMKTLKTLLLAAAALAAVSSIARADIVFGTDAAPYPPFTSQNAAGEWEGWEYEAMLGVCAEMNEKCTMIPIAWDGIIPALLEKKMDGIFGSMAMNDERKKQINFSDMYYDSTTALIGPKGSDKAFTPESLKGKTIGIQAGTSNGNYVEKYYVPAGAVVKAYKGQDEVNADLSAGRIDFIVADAVALKPFLETAEGGCCEIIGAVPMDAAILGNGVGVGFRKEDTALRDKVNAAIKSFANKGGFEALSTKYKLDGLMLTAPKS
jgi:polar amino acid transport system substrate-binding protein